MTYPIKLEECTWKEIQAAMNRGYETVIVPTASVEQHGPHLPLITDTLIAEALAVRIAAHLGSTFVAPVLRPGLSAHHMAFCGSITLTTETFTAMLEETCLSLAEHGFRCLVLISSHGGNFGAIASCAPQIQEKIFERELKANVVPYVDLEKYVRWTQDYVIEHFGREREEAAGHADVAETAMMMALRPDLVHMAQAEPGWMGDLFGMEDKIFGQGLQSVTQNGILGDPRQATAEMGAQLLDYLSTQMADDIRARNLCRR